MNYTFQPCSYQDVEEMIVAHNSGLISPIDSFAEEHILEAAQYTIAAHDGVMGYCSIYEGRTLSQFCLKPTYRHLSQEVFALAKKLESVQEALVATCDEFFLALSVDCCSAIKKQAYFFQYARDIPIETPLLVRYRIATLDDIDLIQQHADDFFDDALERQLRAEEVFIGFEGQTPIAFGVFERGRILRDHVSIGMYTAPARRGRNIGRATLKCLIKEAHDAGLIPIAGCWYYNHVSKRTLEGVGMISNTRYLRIAF